MTDGPGGAVGPVGLVVGLGAVGFVVGLGGVAGGGGVVLLAVGGGSGCRSSGLTGGGP